MENINPLSTKSKNKILNFLPKAAVSFQSPPIFSPAGRDRHKSRFSGAVVSTIMAEARRESKNSNFEVIEPTSPKISCMGQIKHEKKALSKKQLSLPKGFKPALAPPPQQLKKNPSRIRSILRPAAGRKSDAVVEYRKPPAPTLGQMKKFATSRDTFADFDWTKVDIAPDVGEFDSDEEMKEEEESAIPLSAAVEAAGGGSAAALQRRKEINLWERRTMAQPKASSQVKPC